MGLRPQHFLGFAVNELENLIRAHPYLSLYQDEIERLLFNSGDVEKRMAVLNILIQANLLELQQHLTALSLLLGTEISGRSS